jgi:DNA-binding MarR family transcriptional regulator
MEDFAALYMEVIPKAMTILRSEARQEAKEFLSIPQFRILANISRGMKSVGEISQHHGVSQPAMSKMVEALVQKQLLARSVDPNDRRCSVLKMTPQGKTLFLKIKKQTFKKLDALAPNASSEKASLVKAMQELKNFVELVNKGERKE